MTKKIMITALLVGLNLAVLAQTAATKDVSKEKSCSPASCGPEGTKKGEAVAITEVRQELIELMTIYNAHATDNNTETISAKLTVASGNSDDESLLIIEKEFSRLKKEIASELPQLELEIADKIMLNESNKAKYLANLREQIQSIKDQLQEQISK